MVETVTPPKKVPGDRLDPVQPRLLIPALRGRLGDWAYYSCLLELREVGTRVQFARDLNSSKRLSEIIQRGLSSNADRIADYLLGQQQRFMNSLVVAVYGGEPRFHELSVRQTLQETPEDLPELVEMNMGVLELRGDERLMALDGQHRLKGIQLALEQRKGLGDEQVSVIFVGHLDTAGGLQRTRRLFTTLNRYAKPVSQRDLIAQDEDDVVAIVVRRLIEKEPLLRERISDASATSLPVSDTTSVTTLPALYEAMDVILRDRRTREWNNYKRFRPEEKPIRDRLEVALQFWTEIANRVEILRVLRRQPDRLITREERGDGGGHLLLRPVGLTSFARAVRILVDEGASLESAMARLSALPLELGADPWVKVLWNPTTRRMLTAQENRKAATAWLALASGAEETRTLSIGRTETEFRAVDEERADHAMRLLRQYREG